MRATIDLEPFKDEIVQQYHQSVGLRNIVSYLLEHHGKRISQSLLEKRLKHWGEQKNKRSVVPSESERLELILFYFYKRQADDSQILHILAEKGFDTQPERLRRIRLRHGMRRRRKITDREWQDGEIRRILQEHLDRGNISDMGLVHLYTYMRRAGHSMSRKDIMFGLRDVDPDGVERRLRKKQHRRKKYQVGGPNALWSLDAHCKLEIFGIEIYATIDAYSRKILWIYCGISARTAVSCCKQYLDFLQRTKIMPWKIRSDRGNETVLMADAHHQLCCAQDDRSEEDRQFDRVWIFGKSTANQRIESWWMQLQSSQLGRWLRFFDELKEAGHYKKDNTADFIAGLAVYMPFVRVDCQDFQENWNVHKIRKQSNRPHVVGGQPWFLYEYPEAPAEDQSMVPDEELLNQLAKELEAHDLNEYLPADVLEWCHQQMREDGNDPESISAGDIISEEGGIRKHPIVYFQLRNRIRQHMTTGNAPSMHLTEAPKGAGRWQPSEVAIQAFENARRNEEPDEFSDQMNNLQVDDVFEG